MIDLHSHILPFLDDGAVDLEESLKMGRIAALDGITDIVATPHALNGVYQNSRETVFKAVAALKSEFQKADIPINLYPGADVRLNEHILDDVSRGDALTLNDTGKYLFVELPSQVIPEHMAELIFSMKLKGITPIITHPERNIFIEKNPNILFDFVEKGALSQITAISLTGGFGQGARECAKKILKCNLVHIIATDAHSSTKRPPVLSAGVKIAGKVIGREEAEKMVTEIPRKILSGEYIETNDPERYKPFFSFFTS